MFLTPEAASQNVRHFINVLSRQTLGNTSYKYGKRIQIMPIVEGTVEGVLHYHAQIECPNLELRPVFPTLMASIWSQTLWGAQIHVVPVDSGWINYITKQRSKPVFADAVDWQNAHLAIR